MGDDFEMESNSGDGDEDPFDGGDPDSDGSDD
jgi:hypothetical protein